MLGLFILERRVHVRIELDRPEVDILIKRKTRLEQDADLQNAGLDIRMPDGAQVYRVVLPEFLDSAVRQRLAGLEVPLAAEVVIDVVELDLVLGACRVQYLDAFPNHFRARAVARDNGNIVGFHLKIPNPSEK